MTQTQKQTLGDVLVVAGIAAFAYYKYSKLSGEEKRKITSDMKETGRNIIKELIPEQVRGFIPGI